MRHFITTIFFLAAIALPSVAQPKWFKKARKAQANIITYDASGQILRSTNGFFIDTEGTLLTDYAAFKGAVRAVAIDEKGKEYPVETIAGASSLYDVVKVKVSGIQSTPLTLAASAAVGSNAYVMPYLSSKAGVPTPTSVSEVSTFNDSYSYYTLPTKLNEKSTSCPVMNEAGEVLGLVQMAAKDADSKSYVLSATYAQSLATNALSATAADYRDLPIRKALPADASQANSFIYLIGTRDTACYLAYVDDFIRLFPAETGGYTMKAEMLAAKNAFAEADAVWDEGLKASTAADEIHFSRAKSLFAVAQDPKKKDAYPAWTLEAAMQEAEAAYASKPLPIYTALEGHILYAQKQYAQAAGKFLEVCQTNMRSAENFLYAAQCHQMLSDTLAVLAMQDSAVACYTKPYIVEAAPSLLMRAQTLLALHRYREAVADLNDYEHLRSRDVNANFYYQRYQAEMKCRLFQQAINDIERATRMEPNEPIFLAELAATHYRFQQFDQAITAARSAIALDDTFADAHRILGICLRAQKKEQEARASLQRAADLGDELAKDLLKR